MPTTLNAPRNIGDLLNKLAHVKKLADGWQADCPCSGHDTPGKHLHVKDAGDKALVTCFGSHTYEDICKALGYDSLTYGQDTPVIIPPEIVATYDYLDEKRDLLFQVVRYSPKTFKQRHKNGSGEWVWNLEGVRRVLYQLPHILENDMVYLVEGEKDADNLCKMGQLATTSPGGASNWKPEYADFLKGKKVIIIPDKDGPGFGYARQVAKSLKGKAKDIKAIILPGDGVKDVTDWLDAGGDVCDLPSLAQDASVLFVKDKVEYQQDNDLIFWEKPVSSQFIRFQAEKLSEERTGIHARITISLDLPLSWSYLNIERREDRSSLAGAAHSSLGDIGKEYCKDDLRRDLDLFCAGLWEYKTSLFVPELIVGDENPAPLVFLLRPYLLSGGGTILYSPPGRGKALDDETPILTMTGWKTHGSLIIGDSVFGPDGKPKKVLGIRRNEPDRPAYLIIFQDGTQIVADEAHEWIISCDREKYREKRRQHKRPSVRKEEILETKDLLRGQRRAPAIVISKHIQLPYRMLPIDSYVLGCWLGDGTRGTAYITVGNEDISHFRQLGKAIEIDGHWRILVSGLRRELRLMGILREKRIPETYFLASFAQRLSLLQGIMDTDGHIDKKGRCELCTISYQLAHDYLKLISSLGIKTGCWESDAKLYGRVVSKRYRLNFYQPPEFCVFTTPRKIARQKPTVGGMTQNHYVKTVESVHSRPMQCIEVEGGQYLVGESLINTHNSYTALVWAVSVDAGCNKFWPVKQAVVLFINLERARESVRRRLSAVNRVLGLSPTRPLLILNARGKSLSDVSATCRKSIKDHGVGFVVLDSISRAGVGDLTENLSGNKVIDALSGLCPSWLALGHTPRASDGHLYGSIMQDAGADICVQLSSQTVEDTLGIGWELTKQNDTGKRGQEIYALEFGEVGLKDCRKARPFEFPEIEGKGKQSVDEAITDFILEQDTADATATQIAEGTGFPRSTISFYLKKSEKYVETRKGLKNSRYYGVKDRTQSSPIL